MATLDPGSDLGIEHAPDLRELLASQLDSGKQVVIDLSRVERIHSANLQLLCAFVRNRNAAGRKTRVADPSPALVDAVRVLALTNALGMSESGDD